MKQLALVGLARAGSLAVMGFVVVIRRLLAVAVLACGLAQDAAAEGSLAEAFGRSYGLISQDAERAARELQGLIARYDAEGVNDPFFLADVYLATAIAQVAAGHRGAALETLDASGARQLTRRLPENANLRGSIQASFGFYLMAGAAFEQAETFMGMAGWADRFDDETRARMRLLALHAKARGSWAQSGEEEIAKAEAALAQVGRYLDQPGGSVLRELPLAMREYRGDLLAARDGYMALAEGSEGRGRLLARAALADWRLGRRDLARKAAEAALADGRGLVTTRAALMQAIVLLTGESPAEAEFAALLEPFGPEPGREYQHARLVDMLELVAMFATVMAEGPVAERPRVAALGIPPQMLDFDFMPQDAFARSLIAGLRLDVARMLEAEGEAKAARAHYEAVWLRNGASLPEVAQAMAGLARVGLAPPDDTPQNASAFAYDGARAAQAHIEAISARQGGEARRQREAYATLFEGGVDALYDRIEADPPMGPEGAAHVRAFRQTGVFVFPWHETEGYVPLDAGAFWVDRLDEAFGMMQSARQSAAGRAIEAMVARLAAGDDAAGALLRKRDAALARREALVARGPSGQADVTGIDAELDRIEADLAELAPQWQARVTPRQLGLVEARDLLGEGEALLVQLQTARGLHVFIISREAVIWQRSGVTREVLATDVEALRRALDPTGPQRAAVSLKATAGADAIEFDPGIAHRLYRAALGPAVGFVGQGAVIFTVPDGPFQALPMGVLLASAAPEGFDAGKGESGKLDWGKLDWAIRHHGFATLPVPASLRALRTEGGQSAGSLAFLGLADPAFGEGQAGLTLVALPETAGEVAALNQSIAGGEGLVVTGKGVQEAALGGDIPLGDARVLAFATHGLLGGEAAGLEEPALALAAPEAGGDGLLSASEIAVMDLDADWVVLSACNTALGPGGEGAEGLSGLARVFFYAGARRILVSHWAVQSDATVALTTGMFAAMAEGNAGGEATGALALRRSMLEMIDRPAREGWSHPAAWAPFVTVGG